MSMAVVFRGFPTPPPPPRTPPGYGRAGSITILSKEMHMLNC